MTETHGIGRRCENESTLGVRVLSWAIFETKAQKLAMRLAQRGCWRPHNPSPIPINYILVWYISIPVAIATFNDSA